MEKSSIRLLSILPSLIYTGAERQVIDLLNALPEEDFTVHLLTLGEPLDLLPRLDRKKVTFHHHPRRRRLDFSPRKAIAAVIKEKEIDILHCTNQIPILYGFLGRRASGRKVKIIGAIHTTINRNLKNELFDWFLYAPLMVFCDGIITVSEDQKRRWSKKFPYLRKKFITIPNGIDMNRFRDTFPAEKKVKLKRSLGIRERDFLFCILAEFRPEKGHAYALQALKKIVDDGLPVRLLLVGSGEKEPFLRSLAKRLRVEKHVVWVGYQEDPRSFLSICDALCVPSFAETFSLTILEALSMGKPVVATRVGGTPEMIEDGVNGLLVIPRDPEDLAAKMKSLVVDGNLKNNLAAGARDSVQQRFSLSVMVERTAFLFRKMMGEE